MSHEAIAWVRPERARGSRIEFEEKWLTVPDADRTRAREAFRLLGYDVRGLSILTQEEAADRAEALWGTPRPDAV